MIRKAVPLVLRNNRRQQQQQQQNENNDRHHSASIQQQQQQLQQHHIHLHQQQQDLIMKKPSADETALTAKNYRLAKELVSVRYKKILCATCLYSVEIDCVAHFA